MSEKEWTPGPHRVVFGVGDWGMPTSHYILRPGAKDEYDPNGRIALLLSIQPYCAVSSLDQLAVEQRANAQLYAAATDLYAATDFIDHFCLNQTEVSDEARLTIPGPYIRAMIYARRRAREGE